MQVQANKGLFDLFATGGQSNTRSILSRVSSGYRIKNSILNNTESFYLSDNQNANLLTQIKSGAQSYNTLQLGASKLNDIGNLLIDMREAASGMIPVLSQDEIIPGPGGIFKGNYIEGEYLGFSNIRGIHNLEKGTHEIEVVQASESATKVTDGIEILDAWNNGLKLAGAATVAKITGTLGQAGNIGGATATVTFQLNYQESVDGPIGVQNLTFNVSAPTLNMSSTVSARVITEGINSAIADNALLNGKVIASLGSTGQIAIKSVEQGAQYSVMAAGMQTSGDITFNWGSSGYSSIIGDSSRGASVADSMVVSAAVATIGGEINYYRDVQVDFLQGATATVIMDAEQLINIIGSAMRQNFGTIHNLQNPSIEQIGRIEVTGTTTAEGHFGLVMKTRDEGSKFYLKFEDTSNESGRTGLALGITNDTANIHGQDALITLDGFTNTIDDVRYHDLIKQSVLLRNGDGPSAGGFTIDIDYARISRGINLGNQLLYLLDDVGSIG